MIERTQTPIAVIGVDIQRDFCPLGALPVTVGDKIVPVMNEVMGVGRRAGALIINTRDWHPIQTSHFDKWPAHCVQNTPGAEFHPGLVIESTDVIVSKGMGETEDAYSGFDARAEDGIMLDQILKTRGVRRLFIGGLATDYCVKSTVLDGLGKGYEVFVIEDGVGAVDVNPGDGDKAWEEMLAAGAKRIHSNLAEREILGMDAFEAGRDMGRQLREAQQVMRGNV